MVYSPLEEIEMINVVIVGGGNIGSRHLQAAAKLDKAASIYLVEPNESSRNTSLERFREIECSSRHELNVCNCISELPKHLDVVIVATNSAVRRAVIEELIGYSQIRYLILEKFLFQTELDFECVSDLLRTHNIATYTDCTRREMPCYKELKEKLKDAAYVDMSVSGGNWGIGCNGIHMLDLHSFITGEREYSADEVLIDDQIYDSKRSGYIEFCGRMTLKSNKGFVSLTSIYNSCAPVSISIQSDKASFLINEDKNELLVFDANGDKDSTALIRKVDILPNSVVTKNVIDELIDTGSCGLPTYEENSALEKVLLKAFLRKMDSINNESNVICRIT